MLGGFYGVPETLSLIARKKVVDGESAFRYLSLSLTLSVFDYLFSPLLVLSIYVNLIGFEKKCIAYVL